MNIFVTTMIFVVITEESNLNNKDIIVDNNVKIKKDKEASLNDK